MQFLPEGIRFVESDRILRVIMRSKNVQRFTRREHAPAHVGFLTRMISRSKDFFEHLSRALYRLLMHLHHDMFHDRWSDAFIGESKSNRPIAVIEFENRPDRSAHLLALHV